MQDTRHLFRVHLLQFYHGETFEFIEAVEKFKESRNNRRALAELIFKDYIRGDGSKHINLPHNVSKDLFKAYTTFDESQDDIFDSVVASVLQSMKTNFFPSFLRSDSFRRWLYERLKVDGQFIYQIAKPAQEELFPLSQFAVTDVKATDSEEKTLSVATYVSTHVQQLPNEKSLRWSWIRSIFCSIRFFLPAALILQLLFVFLFVFLITYLTTQDSVVDINTRLQVGYVSYLLNAYNEIVFCSV